jgi:hypothetical protein
MINKENLVKIIISVDTTELDEAIKKMKELLELQEKVNRVPVGESR